MSVEAPCSACVAGNHAAHNRNHGLIPGVLGGTHCGCTGDCPPPLSPEMADTFARLDDLVTASPGSEDAGLSAEEELLRAIFGNAHEATSAMPDSSCRFAPLSEHRPGECLECNPDGWMADTTSRIPPGDCSCGASGMPTTHPCGAKCEHA